MLMDHNKMEAF